MAIKISPSVGVARLGNCTTPSEFLLAPDTIGGLPYEVDTVTNFKNGPVVNFKDNIGRVRRQAQLFQVFDEDGEELTLDSPNVVSMEWTIHLANKKAAWYDYSELQGNLLYGEQNSYANQNVPLRNKSVTGSDRQTLVVDPGPRTISGRCLNIEFNRQDVPVGYPAQFPPANPQYGAGITSLGTVKTDQLGRALVIGGYGHAGGDEKLTSYGGSDTWHDDISDGPVYCTVTFDDDLTLEASAWCIVGSPDFVPEIVNISNLSDTMFDVGVRCFNLVPEMCWGGAYNPNFRANYQRDILPIIQRLGAYRWLANVQPMMAFASNIFDFTDNSDANAENRQNYFSYFRAPNDKSNPSPDQPQAALFKENGDDLFPMLPINSGSNSVSNTNIVKFLSLDETQYFLLGQWAAGKFDTGVADPYPISAADAAAVGNCVGLPMCPGIEVTWSLQNPAIYASPYHIADHKGKGGYNDTGLDPSRDECEGGGCEPGDLTKRMACPWQADFFQCTIQYVNFTDPSINKVTVNKQTRPKPPTYYSYWWPPQSPWDVLTGELTVEGQAKGHLPAGLQTNYARGINNFAQMVTYWFALAFVRDRNKGQAGFPFFTETERTHAIFDFENVPVSQITGNESDNETTIPVFYIPERQRRQELRFSADESTNQLMAHFENLAFKPIEIHEHVELVHRSGSTMRH